MQRYRLIAKKGEGTFSEVLKAQNIRNQEYCAIKCMKNHFDSIEQVNNLREIQALQRLSPHPHVVTLFEVLYDAPSGRLALVFELMQMNFYELIRGRRHYLAEATLKNYIYQLCKAMSHMHRHGIFHRDIKPENVLIAGEQLKVADFGSCRGIYSRQPYTEYISTRWYRAPECLLTDGYYSHEMDMWGVGCVMFEVASLFPLFPGTNEMDQIQKIHKILGTPSQAMLEKFKISRAHADLNFPEFRGSGIVPLLPNLSPAGIDLIVRLLEYDPKERMSARAALRHRWFADYHGTDRDTGPDGMHANALSKKSSKGGKSSSGKKTKKWRSVEAGGESELHAPSLQSKSYLSSSETTKGHKSTHESIALPSIHGNKSLRKDEASSIIAKVKKSVAVKVANKKKKNLKSKATGPTTVSGPKMLPSIEKALTIKGHGSLSHKSSVGSRLLGHATLRGKANTLSNEKHGTMVPSYSKKRATKIKKSKKKSI